jgi:Ca-activated chloride channel family protein
LLLIAFFSVRKGWSLNWMAGFLLAIGIGLQPAPAQANALTDAFFTRTNKAAGRSSTGTSSRSAFR